MTTRVSMIQVRALLDAAEQAGVDGRELLRSAGFDAARLEERVGWADLEELDRLIGAVIQATGDPAFGLHWGERSSFTRYDVVAPVIGVAETLRKAIAALLRYHRILSEHDELSTTEEGDTLTLHCRSLATNDVAERVRKELALVGFVRMLRHFAGRDGVARAVAFDYGPPPHVAEYARIFEGKERFRQGWCGLQIPAQILDVKQLGWSSEFHRVMEGHAEEALAEVTGARSQTERIRRVLHRAFPRWLDMSQVARELGMSERSLRRHLTREKVGFPALVMDAQREIAEKLLRDPSRTIQQAAYEMGFSSPSAFHRAFKRWTQKTPTEFRDAAARERNGG